MELRGIAAVAVQLLDRRRAGLALSCGLALALLGCSVEMVSDAGADDASASADSGAVATDAGTDRDAATAPDASDDGGEAMADAGPPPPACPAVECSSLESSTSEGHSVALDACAFGLTLEHPLAEGEALADALLARLEAEGIGTRRDLAYVLAHLNREGVAGVSSATSSRLSGLGARGFRWNSGDEGVTYWYPQGISGSADSGLAGLPPLVMVSWYNKTDARPTKGVRISIADVSDLSNVRYRHLLLVDPIDGAGGADFGPAEYDGGGALHAGGITWIGHRIYVADTSRGLRVYDLSRAFAPSHSDDTDRVGIGSGRSDAHGYAYAVPRVGRYVRASGTCGTRFSFVSRGDVGGEPALITGVYDADTPNGQLVAWPLDVESGLLAGGAVTYASAAAIGGQTRMQGGLRHGETWYASSSSQDGSYGRLYLVHEGEASTSIPWIRGCEDLYLDADDRLWTLAEPPGARDVVSIPRP